MPGRADFANFCQEANSHFQRIYTNKLQIEGVIQMLKGFKTSANTVRAEPSFVLNLFRHAGPLCCFAVGVAAGGTRDGTRKSPVGSWKLTCGPAVCRSESKKCSRA